MPQVEGEDTGKQTCQNRTFVSSQFDLKYIYTSEQMQKLCFPTVKLCAEMVPSDA